MRFLTWGATDPCRPIFCREIMQMASVRGAAGPDGAARRDKQAATCLAPARCREERLRACVMEPTIFAPSRSRLLTA